MNEQELKALIDSKISSGIGGLDGELSNDRQDNIDRYMGELYGYEVEGESSVTTRDVMETIEWAMPSIMRTFANGRQVVQFKPVSAGDEDAAEQETDVVWEIYDDNAGFCVTHTLIKSALLNPNAYVKIFHEDTEKTCKESYEGLTQWELEAVVNSDNVRVVGQESELTEYGMLYDIDVEYEEEDGTCKVIPIPEEELVIDRNHAELSLADCAFTCHRTEKTRSDLIGMGYDEDKLDLVGVGSSDGNYNSERVNRRFYSDEQDDADNDSDKSMQTFWVEECNMFVDYDGDGRAERRRIVKIGNEIFENEEVDTADIVAFSSLLMPHRHVGMCLADLVKDLQEIRTTVMRQVLNNTYKVNNPRTILQGEDGDINMDDVLSNESNGFIRTSLNARILTEPTTPIIAQAIPLFELLNNEKESRTGVSKNAKGLDADVLKNSTMGAYRDAVAQANERIELIIRVLAETGFKEMFCKIHEVEQKNGYEREMQVNGEWIQVNPREWKERKQMRATVGLGFNNMEQKMGAAQVIAARQNELFAAGGMDKLINAQNIYNANELITEAAGENVDKFFMNPAKAQPKQEQPPKPDANMVMIQAQKEIEQMKEAGKDKDRFIKQNEAQWKQYKEQQELELKAAQEGRERAKLELDYDTNIPGAIV